MNFRIVFHLLRTDWQRLRWLVIGSWIFLLVAAWPALTFSPGKFDNPLAISFQPFRLDTIESALQAQGEISQAADWFFATSQWLLNALWVILAGALGFHSKRWTEGRPVRKGEAMIARTAALAIFLFIPMMLVSPVVTLCQGFGSAAAFESFMASAVMRIPGYLVVCLFGVLCGNWWRWLIGIFAFLVVSLVIPPLLRIGSPAHILFSGQSAAWFAVVALGVTALTSRHVTAGRRMAAAILAVVFASVLIPRRVEKPLPANPLPDWSDSVKPTLASPELTGEITTRTGNGGFNPFLASDQRVPQLQLRLDWQSKGLPPGVFASWNCAGDATLRSGDEIITSGVAKGRSPMMGADGPRAMDQNALISALTSGDQPVKWVDYHNQSGDASQTLALFDAVDTAKFKTARLEMDVAGTAYRYVKKLDVPFGRPAQARLGGITVHVRRLDLAGMQPVVDVCYAFPVDGPRPVWEGSHWLPDNSWIPVLHFPDTGEFRLLDNAYWARSALATGCAAARRMYWTCERIAGRKPDLKGFENARFLLIQKEELATMRSHVRSDDLPLLISMMRDEAPDARKFREPPPFYLRPDPEKTTPQEFDRWMTRSYNVFDSQGWDSRNIAEFVPTHLDQILHRKTGVHPPSSPEGKAIALACPESRRDKIIAALSRKQDPNSDWIPDLILRRGWAKEAAPQIREMAAQHKIGTNPYSQLMTMMLEDPQTYPALLENRMWFEIYEQARRLPGVEPLLTETLTKRFHEDLKNDAGDSRDKIFRYLPAAAYGLPDAFSACLAAWPSTESRDRRIVGEYLREIMLIPGTSGDLGVIQSALDTKRLADFRYDPLARCWVLVSESSR